MSGFSQGFQTLEIADESGRHIGNVMYYNIDAARDEAEIGIRIGERDYWSRGYGSDALETVARLLLASGEVRRLYLHTLDWNGRAQKAFQKAGFVVCGTSWRDGHNFIVMEMRREWLEPSAALPERQVVA